MFQVMVKHAKDYMTRIVPSSSSIKKTHRAVVPFLGQLSKHAGSRLIFVWSVTCDITACISWLFCDCIIAHFFSI